MENSAATQAVWFSRFRPRWVKRPVYLILLMAVALTPLQGSGSNSDGYTPLFSSLEHSIGDQGAWQLQGGVLTSEPDSRKSENVFLLTEERFANFILRFRFRSNGADATLLFRASILPPGQLVGFATELGGERLGDLTFLKPIPQFQRATKGEPGHAAPGFPDAVAMPFLRKTKEVELVSPKSKIAFSSDEWMNCEIDALENHLLIKVNGVTTAQFRVGPSFFEKVLGFPLPPQMAEVHGPFYEGMIGFQVPPEAAGKVEFKDLQIKLLGNVRWSGDGPANETWKASPLGFQRTTGAQWSRETHELLETARKDAGFRPIFNGKSLQGWSDSARFWDAENGEIVGEPYNDFLVTDREYSDFIMKGAVSMSPPGSNSGVQFRSVVIPHGEMRGYQFDMGIPWWGQVYVESSLRGILVPVEHRMRRVSLIHSDGWNDFVIICKGDHLIGLLNGEITYDLVDYYGERTGRIGLQIHAGAPMKVEFKDLEIKELN